MIEEHVNVASNKMNFLFFFDFHSRKLVVDMQFINKVKEILLSAIKIEEDNSQNFIAT